MLKGVSSQSSLSRNIDTVKSPESRGAKKAAMTNRQKLSQHGDAPPPQFMPSRTQYDYQKDNARAGENSAVNTSNIDKQNIVDKAWRMPDESPVTIMMKHIMSAHVNTADPRKSRFLKEFDEGNIREKIKTTIRNPRNCVGTETYNGTDVDIYKHSFNKEIGYNILIDGNEVATSTLKVVVKKDTFTVITAFPFFDDQHQIRGKESNDTLYVAQETQPIEETPIIHPQAAMETSNTHKIEISGNIQHQPLSIASKVENRRQVVQLPAEHARETDNETVVMTRLQGKKVVKREPHTHHEPILNDHDSGAAATLPAPRAKSYAVVAAAKTPQSRNAQIRAANKQRAGGELEIHMLPRKAQTEHSQQMVAQVANKAITYMGQDAASNRNASLVGSMAPLNRLNVPTRAPVHFTPSTQQVSYARPMAASSSVDMLGNVSFGLQSASQSMAISSAQRTAKLDSSSAPLAISYGKE